MTPLTLSKTSVFCMRNGVELESTCKKMSHSSFEVQSNKESTLFRNNKIIFVDQDLHALIRSFRVYVGFIKLLTNGVVSLLD